MPRNCLALPDLVLLEAHRQLSVAAMAMRLYKQVREAWGSCPPKWGS